MLLSMLVFPRDIENDFTEVNYPLECFFEETVLL